MRTSARAAAGLAAAALSIVGTSEPVAAVTPQPPPRGKIVICGHAAYTFRVYADGPSIRTGDLSGTTDECTRWKPVLPGKYEVGFLIRIRPRDDYAIEARVRQGRTTFYKVIIQNGGYMATWILPQRPTRVDLFIRRA